MKFLWPISGPPATVANFGYHIFGYLHDFWTNGRLLIGPKWTNFDFLQQILIYKIKIIRRYLSWKITLYVSRALLVKRMPAHQPNMGLLNCFDHFEFKIQINFGSVLCRNLLQSNIGIVGFGWLALGHGQKCFIQILNLVFQF